MADPELDGVLDALLTELMRFQDRVYQLGDPHKFKMKRRFVCGLREVLKHLHLRKLKAVILTRNLDRITSTGVGWGWGDMHLWGWGGGEGTCTCGGGVGDMHLWVWVGVGGVHASVCLC